MFIITEITFRKPEEGGRQSLPQIYGSGRYSPHLVINDQYFGVQFIGGDQPCYEVSQFVLNLMYLDVDYSPLTTNTEFEIREGRKIVATGKILKGIESDEETRQKARFNNWWFINANKFIGAENLAWESWKEASKKRL